LFCSGIGGKWCERARSLAEEILDETLTRIVEVDGRPGALDTALAVDDEKKVHAFITHTEELARSQAQEVDAKIAKGEDAGLLAGFLSR
jgi:aspartyl-tRNA(Asn)/glutamyl-tRNA(Gln) amidotransferase subunit A